MHKLETLNPPSLFLLDVAVPGRILPLALAPDQNYTSFLFKTLQFHGLLRCSATAPGMAGGRSCGGLPSKLAMQTPDGGHWDGWVRVPAPSRIG